MENEKWKIAIIFYFIGGDKKEIEISCQSWKESATAVPLWYYDDYEKPSSRLDGLIKNYFDVFGVKLNI